MPLFVPILAALWLFVILVALLLCVAARRMDEELARGELAPVIDIAGGRLSGRHIA
jgi:hypothetical protein